MASCQGSLYLVFLVSVVVLNTIPERHLAARVLDDVFLNGTFSPSAGGNVGGELSKGEVNTSQHRKDGSAIGNNDPLGSVQLSPPTAFTDLSFNSSKVSTPSQNSSMTCKSAVKASGNARVKSSSNVSVTTSQNGQKNSSDITCASSVAGNGGN